MLNANELQIVNDFLTAVAPKLNGNTNINLNEAEMLLSISAITLLCREKAQAGHQRAAQHARSDQAWHSA
jgi:hypothetical protein